MSAQPRPQRSPAGSPLTDQLGALLESLADAAVLIDTSGRILYFNHQAEKLAVLSRTVVVGERYENCFPANQWLVDLIARTLESGQAHTDHHGVIEFGPSATGERGAVPVAASVTPWRDAGGKDQGALVLLSDRTRLATLEHDLIRSDRLASLGTIAAGLAHEIKNPLGGIKGAAQLLRRSNKDPGAYELLEVILNETDRVNAILQQLLDIGRPAQRATGWVNLHQILQDVTRLVGLSEAGRDKHFETRFDPSLPPIRGAADPLKQVFLNLLQNAAEACNEEARIEVFTRIATDIALREAPTGQVRGFLQIGVRDDGPGIPPEDLSKLFTPFFTTKERGTGLGLVVSHQIIKEHGGFLTVESSPGRGTTFTVHLPRGS